MYGVQYLAAVAVATVAVASLAWATQNRELALGAAVLGMYALHLTSVRYILQNQRQHRAALESQYDLLQRLVESDVARSERAPVPATEGPGAGPDLESHAGREPAGPVTAERPLAPSLHARSRSERSGPLPGNGARAGNGSTAPAGGAQVRRDAAQAPLAGTAVGPLAAPRAPVESEPETVSRLTEFENSPPEIPIPRHFALGTVALIRQLLTPAEVARVLIEQRRQPDRRFATLAVEMGLLDDSQREELLLAQQEGLFTEQEMREARERLREFRESTARALSDLD